MANRDGREGRLTRSDLGRAGPKMSSNSRLRTRFLSSSGDCATSVCLRASQNDRVALLNAEMSLVSLFKGKGPSGYGYGTTAEVVTQGVALKGKNFLVTGSTSGIGLETVRVLAQRGARVFATGRSKEKVVSALGRTPGVVVPLECELSEPKSVRGCVSALKSEGAKLDGIIANAGVMALPSLELVHGYERQFFTNHIGHFLLVTGLLSELTEKARVVMLSSSAHNMAPKAGIEFENLAGQ